jgi:hypothetical protein
MAVPASSSGGAPKRGKNLEPAEVRAIAECVAAGERHALVAERFGVSARGASAIDDALRAKMAAVSNAPVLDAESARRVMTALEAGRPGRFIAEEFGISPSMVSAIKHGRAWSALDPDLPARLAVEPRKGKALVADQVSGIKQRLLEGRSTRSIAVEFGVSASTIQAISQGRTWAEVAPADEE